MPFNGYKTLIISYLFRLRNACRESRPLIDGLIVDQVFPLGPAITDYSRSCCHGCPSFGITSADGVAPVMGTVTETSS